MVVSTYVGSEVWRTRRTVQILRVRPVLVRRVHGPVGVGERGGEHGVGGVRGRHRPAATWHGRLDGVSLTADNVGGIDDDGRRITGHRGCHAADKAGLGRVEDHGAVRGRHDQRFGGRCGSGCDTEK